MQRLEKNKIDWMVTLVPFILIVGLASLLFILPEQSNAVIGEIRFFFGDTVGLYYLVIGLGVLAVSLYLRRKYTAADLWYMYSDYRYEKAAAAHIRRRRE